MQTVIWGRVGGNVVVVVVDEKLVKNKLVARDGRLLEPYCLFLFFGTILFHFLFHPKCVYIYESLVYKKKTISW